MNLKYLTTRRKSIINFHQNITFFIIHLLSPVIFWYHEYPYSFHFNRYQAISYINYHHARLYNSRDIITNHIDKVIRIKYNPIYYSLNLIKNKKLKTIVYLVYNFMQVFPLNSPYDCNLIHRNRHNIFIIACYCNTLH